MPPSTACEMARELLAQLPASPQNSLQAVAERLRAFARSSMWQHAPYREAGAGEELLYELALSPQDGSSLYLVCDGAGVVSSPHCHNTWAVIAGIRGQELNHRYAVQSIEQKTVLPTTQVDVGRGQVLVLGEKDVIQPKYAAMAPPIISTCMGVRCMSYLRSHHVATSSLRPSPSLERACLRPAAHGKR
jgi:predicted metal-dependent enzyme (double-stranded beta helix superfamily)